MGGFNVPVPTGGENSLRFGIGRYSVIYAEPLSLNSVRCVGTISRCVGIILHGTRIRCRKYRKNFRIFTVVWWNDSETLKSCWRECRNSWPDFYATYIRSEFPERGMFFSARRLAGLNCVVNRCAFSVSLIFVLQTEWVWIIGVRYSKTRKWSRSYLIYCRKIPNNKMVYILFISFSKYF